LYHDENSHCQRFAKPFSARGFVACGRRAGGDNQKRETIRAPFARCAGKTAPVQNAGHHGAIDRDFGDRVFSSKEIAKMRAAELEGEEG
jgi:hypothetical protein